MPMTGLVLKERETLFTYKTGHGLDRFDKGPWEFLQTQWTRERTESKASAGLGVLIGSPRALPCFSMHRKTTRASFIMDPLKFVGQLSMRSGPRQRAKKSLQGTVSKSIRSAANIKMEITSQVGWK